MNSTISLDPFLLRELEEAAQINLLSVEELIERIWREYQKKKKNNSSKIETR